MIARRATITPLGCTLLAVILALVTFGIAVADLALPSVSYPKAGEPSAFSYRVPSVQTVVEGDGERVVQWRGRFEILVGQRADERELTKLRRLETDKRPPSLGFSLGILGFLIGLFGVATQALRLFVRNGSQVRIHIAFFVPLLLLLGIGKVVFLLTPIPVYWLPLAALSIPWAILHSRRAGAVMGVVGAFCSVVLFPMDWGLAVTLAAQATVPPLLMDPIRKRRTAGVSWLGGAFAGVLAYIAYHFVSQGALPTEDLSDAARSGLVATAGAAALSPILGYGVKVLLGWMLGVVSRSALMELADLDHPLLKQVATEAPGTWQHTLSMANMAEVVCTALGIDALLTRVGAYFHDAGKSLNPKYFAENLEPGERSPHTGLPAEESTSAIFDHVVDGVSLARQHKVPYAVREFIYTHHGTGLLEFFWHKCQEQGNPRTLPESAFHYPGIPPQTQETAVLAIVDAVEAASRTLREPDADQIDALVQRIVFGKLYAGQLSEAGLSAHDLGVVVTTLRDTLRSQFHVRPEYPWQKRERERQAPAGAPAHPAPPEPSTAAPPVHLSQTIQAPPAVAAPPSSEIRYLPQEAAAAPVPAPDPVPVPVPVPAPAPAPPPPASEPAAPPAPAPEAAPPEGTMPPDTIREKR
jgi:hypothetical protein